MQNPYNVWGTIPTPPGSSEPAPSIYGALPYVSPQPHSSSHIFTFTSLNPSITNCNILGPNNLSQFLVFTDPALPTYTLLKSSRDGRNLGLIEWKSSGHTEVELRHIVPKQRANQFLRVSSDNRYWIMRVGETDYIWLVEKGGVGALSLYVAGDSSSNRLAKLTKSTTEYKLEMTNDAVQAGLLLPALLSIVLLQSGHAF